VKETELSPIITEWLVGNGYQVYYEVPVRGSYRYIDVVGRRGDNHTIAIELKRSLSLQVVHQAMRLTRVAHRVYCAVGSRNPKQKTIDNCQRWNLGVLSLADYKVKTILEAADNPQPHIYMMRVDAQLSEVGGLPARRGEGHAITVIGRVMDYLKEHPQASWAELYDRVPNHYAHPKSMRSAIEGKVNKKTVW